MCGFQACHMKDASHEEPHVLQLMKRSKFSLTSAFSCPVRSLSSRRRLASPARSSPRLVSCRGSAFRDLLGTLTLTREKAFSRFSCSAPDAGWPARRAAPPGSCPAGVQGLGICWVH